MRTMAASIPKFRLSQNERKAMAIGFALGMCMARAMPGMALFLLALTALEAFTED